MLYHLLIHISKPVWALFAIYVCVLSSFGSLSGSSHWFGTPTINSQLASGCRLNGQFRHSPVVFQSQYSFRNFAAWMATALDNRIFISLSFAYQSGTALSIIFRKTRFMVGVPPSFFMPSFGLQVICHSLKKIGRLPGRNQKFLCSCLSCSVIP